MQTASGKHETSIVIHLSIITHTNNVFRHSLLPQTICGRNALHLTAATLLTVEKLVPLAREDVMICLCILFMFSLDFLAYV